MTTGSAVLGRRPLGATGLSIGRLSFGSAPLATGFWNNNESRAIATAQRALAAGITLFDTAPLYGSGEAEQRLGTALADAADVVVATKVGRTLPSEAIEPALEDDAEVAFDYSAAAVRRQLEGSLRRLGRDRVDIVHVHDPDDHLRTVIDECLPALAAMKAEGLLSAISLGTMSCATALHVLRHADLDVLMIANRLTLLDHSAADEVLPACAAAGVPVLAAGVFNSGILARPVAGSWFDYAPASADVLARAQRMAERCTAAGVTLRAAAMAYPLRFSEVATVVVGMAAPNEVDDNIAALDRGIPDDLWAELDTAAFGVP